MLQSLQLLVTDAAEARSLPSPSGCIPTADDAQRSTAVVPGPWFALRLRANTEFKVSAALAHDGIESFLPTWSETVQWSDRKKTTVRPLFPGYVFVRFATGAQKFAALTTRGVVQLLPNSFKPEPIASSEIDSINRVLESKAAFVPCLYRAGERVTIDTGSLAGVSGVVVRTRGSLRVIVSVELLNRAVSVELDAKTLLKETN